MTIGELWRRITFFVRGANATKDLEDEMRLHLALRAERNERSGMTRDAAAAAAHRRFGSPIRAVEASRDAWLARWIDALRHDVRYAARGLRRSPTYASVAVLTLALGLGLNAAIYSLLDRLFLRVPAAVAEPQSVRRLYVTQTFGNGQTVTRDQFNYPESVDLRRAMDAASVGTTAYATDTAAYTSAGDPRIVAVAYTDSAYWSVLGVRPAFGRTPSGDEARIETPGGVAIVSDAFWRRELGAARDAVGRTLLINDHRATIIGVAPPRFTGIDLDAVDVWLPVGAMPMDNFGPGRFWYQIRSSPELHLIARSSGTNTTGLDSRLTAALRAGQDADNLDRHSGATISTGPIIHGLGPMTTSQETIVATRLAWVSLLVLLVACASVANLMVTRLTDRRREIAVRVSLGAARSRIALQLIVESLMIGVLALGGALVTGSWAGALLRRMLMPATHWDGSVIEWRLAVGMGLAALAAAIVVGLIPVMQLKHFGGADALRGGSRATPHAARVRGALVILQTALAVVLVSGSALFIQSLRRVQHVDVGYDVSNILIAEPHLLGERGGADMSRSPLLRTALVEAAQRLSAVPSVAGVSLASHGPMAGYYATGVRVPGLDSMPKLNGRETGMHQVSPEYWSVVGLHAVSGRVTTSADVAGAPLVIIVNETMARTVWPGRSPLGQCVQINGPESTCRTVVGVVRDAHLISIVEPPRMVFYVPLAQGTSTGTAAKPSAIILRAMPGRAAAAEAIMRRTLTELLPSATLQLSEMRQMLDRQLRPWRLGATLFSVLGALALVIASVGLYGVIAYGVRSRTRELGIRLALGAPRDRVAGVVVGNGVRTVAIGVVGGGLIAVLSVRFVGSLLYDTSLRDPSILITVGFVMLSTAVLASLVPAWRASRVDPVVALRSE